MSTWMKYDTRSCLKWDSHIYMGLVTKIAFFPWHFPFGTPPGIDIDHPHLTCNVRATVVVFLGG